MTIKVNSKLAKLVLGLTVTLLLLQGMVITKNAIVTYIGKEFVTPFLVQALTTPKDLNKGLTINKLMK